MYEKWLKILHMDPAECGSFKSIEKQRVTIYKVIQIEEIIADLIWMVIEQYGRLMIHTTWHVAMLQWTQHPSIVSGSFGFP